MTMFTVHAHAAAQTTSPIQCRRATLIRDGLVSARRPVLTILFHGQERNSATEPSLWPEQLYGTVYRQQFVNRQLVFVQAQAQNSFLPSVLPTNCMFLCILQTFVMHSRSGAEYREGITTTTYLLTIPQTLYRRNYRVTLAERQQLDNVTYLAIG